MDIPNLVALVVTTPWAWIVIKFIMVGDLIEAIPLAILGYFLLLLHDLDLEKVLKDEKQTQEDEACQTDLSTSEEKSTQTVRRTNEASTQVSVQSLEMSTQTVQTKTDASSQTERKEYDENCTQTMLDNLSDKAPLQEPDNKATQTASVVCLEKEVQTPAALSVRKVFVPVKQRKPKPTFPPTKAFKKYHRNKHILARQKLKFKTKLPKIAEVDENEDKPESCKLLPYNELKFKKRLEKIAEVAENEEETESCKLPPYDEARLEKITQVVGHEDRPKLCKQPPYDELTLKTRLERMVRIDGNEDKPELCKLPSHDEFTLPDKTTAVEYNVENSVMNEADENVKESDMVTLSSSEERKLQASAVKKTVIEPDYVLESADVFNDDHHVHFQDDTELKKKQKKASFFKKKFTKLKKYFKK